MHNIVETKNLLWYDGPRVEIAIDNYGNYLYCWNLSEEFDIWVGITITKQYFLSLAKEVDIYELLDLEEHLLTYKGNYFIFKFYDQNFEIKTLKKKDFEIYEQLLEIK